SRHLPRNGAAPNLARRAFLLVDDLDAAPVSRQRPLPGAFADRRTRLRDCVAGEGGHAGGELCRLALRDALRVTRPDCRRVTRDADAPTLSGRSQGPATGPRRWCGRIFGQLPWRPARAFRAGCAQTSFSPQSRRWAYSGRSDRESI